MALLRPLISVISDGNWEEMVISRITEMEESIGTDAEIDLSEMEKRQEELLEEYAAEASEPEN
ncbi:MAG: hypothetical protein LIO80_00610 [Lachnospiraceae bacterium]|nr:hypothetical protein [Lachnospiraceae bacterium]